MKRYSLEFFVLFLGLASLSALAQKPLPRDPAQMVQHRVNFLTERLGLSADQQQQATTIFTNAMNGQKSLHEQMRSAHQALQSAIATGNNAAIDQAAGNIGNLVAQMTAAHAKADAQFFQTLNADQQAKFTELESHGHGNMFRRRGFGGHGGPPE